MSDDRTARPEPTSMPVLRRILAYGALLMLAIVVVGGVLGGIFAGVPGLLSALVGTVMAGVFMGITAASIILANRVASSEALVGAFFGIVLGGWILKIILFFVLVLLLQPLAWVDPLVMFLAIVAGVVGSLVVDVLVVSRTRLGNVSDVTLPTRRDHDDDA